MGRSAERQYRIKYRITPRTPVMGHRTRPWRTRRLFERPKLFVKERTMQIAAGHNVTPSRNQLVAITVVLVLLTGIAGGMLFASRAELIDLLGSPENSLPENTRPMILVPLPR